MVIHPKAAAMSMPSLARLKIIESWHPSAMFCFSCNKRWVADESQGQCKKDGATGQLVCPECGDASCSASAFDHIMLAVSERTLR